MPQIGPTARRFASLKQREEFFRSMIQRYNVGDRVIDAQDVADLRALLHHLAPLGLPRPDAVDYFYVALSQYQKKNFRGKGLDGGSFDISYSRNALNRATSDSLINEAFRLLVANDKKAFKIELARNRGPIACEHCGRSVTIDDVEADHHPITFVSLMDQFLAIKGIARSDLAVRNDGGGGVGLVDVEIGRTWRAYHQVHHKFVPSCFQCNREKSKGEPIRT